MVISIKMISCTSLAFRTEYKHSAASTQNFLAVSV